MDNQINLPIWQNVGNKIELKINHLTKAVFDSGTLLAINENVVSVNKLLDLNQNTRQAFGGCLLPINESVENNAGGCLLSINELTYQVNGGCLLSINELTQNVSTGGCLLPINEVVANSNWGKIDNSDKYLYQFKKGYHKEDFTILVFIDGIPINPCELFEKCEITRSENQASIAKLTLLKKCEDLYNGYFEFYEYSGKIIDIYYQSRNKYTKIFHGIISYPEHDTYRKTVTLNCTDDKLYEINNLPDEIVKSIGVFSEKLFPDCTKEEEFNKRMESIPASYYFDLSGNFVLSYWVPSWLDYDLFKTISGDDIRPNTLKITGLQVGRVVNRVNLKFNRVYPRKMERTLNFSWDNNRDWSQGGLICDIMRYNFLFSPPVKSVKQAIDGAGWIVSNFYFTGLPKAGTYTCTDLLGNRGEYLWNPNGISYTYEEQKDANGNTITQNGQPTYQVKQGVRFWGEKYYATSASWRATKRWIQNVEENYEVAILNYESIDFFKEKGEELNFSIKYDLSDSDDWVSSKCLTYPAGTRRTLSNGDLTIDNSQSREQEFQEAFNYAYSNAYRKIVHSHRDNYISAQIKFMPDLDLSDTMNWVNIPCGNILGYTKTCEFTHSIDFSNKKADTNIKTAFIFGFNEIAIDGFKNFGTWYPASRPTLPVAQRQQYTSRFGLHIIGNPIGSGSGVFNLPTTAGNMSKQKLTPFDILGGGSSNKAGLCDVDNGDDGLYGYVVQRTLRNENDKQGLFNPIKFAIKTPEIEKESTDAVKGKLDIIKEINIPEMFIYTEYICRD